MTHYMAGIRGYERVANGEPESLIDRDRREVLEDILRFALRELDEGRDPTVVAQALCYALVTA